jgi:hypothetical protein
MNCRKARDNVLREQSRELGAGARSRLRRHLARCADCRAWSEDAARVLAAAAPARLAAQGPAPAVIQAILREASGRPAAAGRLAPAWRPIFVYPLAAAALAAILLAGMTAVLVRQAVRQADADRLARRTAALTGMVAMAVEGEGWEQAAVESAGEDENALLGLARHLLRLEGMAVDESEEADAPATAPEEHPPTTLRARSSPEPLA